MSFRFQAPACQIRLHAENVRPNAGLHESAVALAEKHSSSAGQKLGSVHSQDKAKAAQQNGQKGGRPVGS